MKKILTTLLFFALTTAIFGQKVKHYDFKVKFDIPQKKIDVEGIINIDMNNQDSIIFTLWKDTDIKNITIGGKSVSFSFDTIEKSPIAYIPNGGKLTIRNIKKQPDVVPIHFAYTCNMENVTGWAKSFSEKWIELGFYTAWYPVHSTSMGFTSRIAVSIDSSFVVSGSGIVTKEGKDWVITHSWPVFDNVIIAAKDLKTKEIREGKLAFDLVYTTFPEKDLDSVAIKCKEIYTFYSNIFGQSGDSSGMYLKFAINPLESSGGFSRSKFILLGASGFSQDLENIIAHEVAHFWWHRAKATTWEDWLNESFAECSMLLYLREKDSKEEYNSKIEQFKKQTINSKPIWGIDRKSSEARAALYDKGSLILLEFEEKIGTKEFYKFFKMLSDNKISNTSDFLKFVETKYSKEYRIWFEQKLKA